MCCERCKLHTVLCTLWTPYCVVHTVNSLLRCEHCELPTGVVNIVNSLLCCEYCELPTVLWTPYRHCKLPTVLCTLWTPYCVVNTVNSLICCEHCELPTKLFCAYCVVSSLLGSEDQRIRRWRLIFKYGSNNVARGNNPWGGRGGGGYGRHWDRGGGIWSVHSVTIISPLKFIPWTLWTLHIYIASRTRCLGMNFWYKPKYISIN